MIKLFLQTLGWAIARTPEPLLNVFARVLGAAVFRLMPRRRRLFFTNLGHAFPDRTRAWQAGIARECSSRLVETALLSLATPYLSEKRLRAMICIAPEVEAVFAEHQARPFPLIVATPHIAYWESLTTLRLHLKSALPEFGVIFRPLDNPAADAWVKSTRERHGMRLLSRKDGLAEAFRILRRHAVVGLLFDQNAGLQGALTTLFGRVCSTTELPGTLAEKFGARIMAYYPRRLGFWRLRFEATEIAHNGTAADVTFALNRWLEVGLAADDDLCSSWLWSHDRWRHQDTPAKRLRLESKRNLLAADIASRHLDAIPRRTRLFVRLPNWLGDVVMALPLLRALRASRPDAELTLIAKPAFHPLLRQWAVADRLEALPPRGPAYFLKFWKLRQLHPDAYLLFTNSLRGDIEAWLTAAPQRFGILRPRRARPLLTHTYRVPPDFKERDHHQLELWENFLRHFGLAAPVDRTPFHASPLTLHASSLGFIPGSENNPEKRWPVAHWRALIERLLADRPATQIHLFGTANDRTITAAIAAGFGDRVQDLAGRTDLAAYVEKLRACGLLVTNDTGGMHLANALGVPLLALFGPTNPVRTAPVFTAPVEILQPPGCPPAGGAALRDLSPETVSHAVARLLTSHKTDQSPTAKVTQ